METPQAPDNQKPDDIDEQLRQQSGGDQGLFDRLRARHLAHERLAQEPDNPAFQTLAETMDAEVVARQQQLGIIPPEQT